jgi:chromate transporter
VADTGRAGYLELFLSFLRLGVGAFGGPAMVVYIRELAVRKKGWLDGAAFDDGVALCQSIPGATAMQAAGYVGLKSRGVLGALCSYVGFGTPAFFLMLLSSHLYAQYHELKPVTALFAVLQIIVVALIGNATLLLGKDIVKRPVRVVIVLISATLFLAGASPFLVILCGAATGMLVLRESGEKGRLDQSSPNPFHVKQVAVMLLVLLLSLICLYMVDKTLFDLSLVMLKVDLFAFGGGFAALPLMLHEVVQSRGWMTEATFMDGIALGQVTPGPIVITSTFVGYMVRGLAGAMAATLAIFTPSFIMLLLAAPFFERYKSSPYFLGATKGAFLTFVGLLLYMTFRFASLVSWDLFSLLVCFASFLALLRKIDTFYVVLAGALLSLIVSR